MDSKTKKAKKSSSWSIILIVIMGLLSLGLILYVPFSQWWNDKEHAAVIAELNDVVAVGPEARLAKIRESAHNYNKELMASGDHSDYFNQLDPANTGLMGRIKIDKINVDLPIFHTSSDATLRKGAGHMKETTLPVGGIGTHAAITAHRGLAESKLFTDLDKVHKGDRFTLEVLGEPLVYQVETVRIVKPTETDWLLVDPNRDLVTLITCDPLGINTERMLVTGFRVDPTPSEALDDLGKASKLPGFPWWAVYAVIGIVMIIILVKMVSKPVKKKTPGLHRKKQR